MSIDVSYFSFSPSRADKQWPSFIEDITQIRIKHFAQSKGLQEVRDERTEADAYFKPLIQKAREEVLNYLDEEGYVLIPCPPFGDRDLEEIPQSWTEEEKMRYVLAGAPLFRRGSKVANKNTPHFILTPNLPLYQNYDKLSKQYSQIKNKINNALYKKNRSSTLPNQPQLTKRQVQLEKGVQRDYLIYEHRYNVKVLLSALIDVDLFYGSVGDAFIDFENTEYEHNEQNDDVFVGALVKVFDLITEKSTSTNQNLPTKQGWIKVFENICQEKINAVADYVASELDVRNGISKDESIGCVVAFLRAIRPVVKDLKENPDAFFVRHYEGGESEMLPADKKILEERAKKHAEKYKGLLPPVL